MIKISLFGVRMEVYLPKVGIWGWLNRYSSSNNYEWLIYIQFNENRYSISSNGLILENGFIPVVKSPSKVIFIQDGDLENAYIPVWIEGSEVFTLHLKGTHKFNLENMEDLLYSLQSMLSNESRDIFSYPSFLPFFLPGLGNNETINSSIIRDRPAIFLNGQEGTGKNTFIRNYILYHFYRDVGKVDGISNENQIVNLEVQGRIISIEIILELAMLEIEEQEILAARLFKKEPDKYFFICSIYDLALLHEKGMIIEGIYNVCLENRVMFPRVEKRIAEAIEILKYILLTKGINLPETLINGWKKCATTRAGFKSMLAQIEPALKDQGALVDQYGKGKALRDIIAEIENDSIRFALTVLGNSQNKIAKFLGISRGSLQHKLKKYEFPYYNWEE